MRISVCIVAKTFNEEMLSLTSRLKIFADNPDTEILIGLGSNPSKQRNELANSADGEFLLFLDDDSDPDAQLLAIYQKLINKYPEVDVFGGPSLLKKEKDLLNRLSQVFFSSAMGIGPFRCRYNSLGNERSSDEREIILSNFLIKKDFFLSSKGFNVNFYPGEENEYLNRVKPNILYSPDAIVQRYPRKSFRDFVIQMFSYGKGRAKHLGFNRKDSLFLIPAVFSLYIVTSVFMAKSHPLILLPLLLYGLILTPDILTKAHGVKDMVSSYLFFLFAHSCYGLGIFTGIVLKRAKNKKFDVDIEILRIKNFNSAA